jgi:enoyl-CoA hydratase/carnithine racemase
MHTTYDAEGPVATLTFNRPDVRNAMTWEMYDALVRACDRADGDSQIRVLMIRGAGGQAFVAGTDIGQFEGFASPQDGIRYEEQMDEVLGRLERMTKATIAVVQGVAAGGGCAIAAACDLRLATPESTFGIPIARTLGNCLSGATYGRLVDLVGPGVVMDLLLTGRMVNASEALALGLVNRIVPADAIDAAAREYALRIAGNAPLTIRATKELLRRIAAHRRLRAGEDRDVIAMCYGSHDFHQAVSAFLAKRAPQWTGT